MKIKLKYKLILIYTSLISILIISIVLVSNSVFRGNFDNYILNNNEEKAQEIVRKILLSFQENGEPTYEELYKIGIDALNDGLILMVNKNVNEQLICISDVIPHESIEMLVKMEDTLHSVHPHMDGAYEEARYIIEDEEKIYGYVTLGFYGPIYYSEFDALLLNGVEKAIYICGIIFFAISALIIYFLASKISEPIHKVSLRAKELRFGKYKEKIEITSSTTEIFNLINSINNLASSLETQQEIKKDMAKNYTHEIRTPLTCVLTTLEGMKAGIFDITDERLNSLYFEVERISNMVADVDKLIEISNQKDDLEKKQIDFEELIFSSIRGFESQFKTKKISLTFNNLSNGENIILADEEKIKSLLGNLLSNALKYTDEGGFVIVTLCKDHSNFILKVKDNGIGIEEKEFDLIFEHMHRTDISRAKGVDGFGIGLAICKSVCSLHCGEIEVNSKIGEGSEFIVTLPINLED